MIKGKVENIKDKIDGNELDLSLSNLTEVPVKELVSSLTFQLSWVYLVPFFGKNGLILPILIVFIQHVRGQSV